MATESRVGESGLSSSRFVAIARDQPLVVPFLLGGVILVAAIVRFVLARGIVTPWIMADELIYSELAKSFAEHGEFLVRDAAAPFDSVLYPALISPAWFANEIQTAYNLARAINAVLMTATALPVYFWGRRLMAPRYALISALLVLVMPPLTYSGMLMTENAFFLGVVSSCFAIAVALERPTLLHQAVALGAIALTCAVRFQGLVLLIAYVAALGARLLLDLRAPDGGRGVRFVLGELRRFLPTALVVGLAGAAYIAMKARQGAALESGLGAYGGILQADYDLSTAASWVIDHFAEITLSVAVIPVSALIVVVGLALLGRATTAAERAYLAVASCGFLLVVTQVGVYASRFSLRIEERNMFGVVPLLFLALGLWLAWGLPRPLVLTAVAAVVPAALLLSLDLKQLLNIGILSDTFALIQFRRLTNTFDIDTVQWLMLLGGAVAAAAFALLPRRVAAIVLPAGVAIALVLSSYTVYGAIRDYSRATLALTDPSDPDWIDDRIGSGSDAAFVYGVTGDLFAEAQILWQTEFWNRSVGDVYRLGPPGPAAFPEQATTFDPNTGEIRGAGAQPRYAVAHRNLELDGRLLASAGSLSLYRVGSPMRVTKGFGGVYADGWMGAFAALTQYVAPAPSSHVRLVVSRAGWGGPSPPGKVTVRVGRLAKVDGQPGIRPVTSTTTFTLRSLATRRLRLPLPASPFRVEIQVDPTFSPANYGLSDPRQLGAQVSVQVEPS